MKRREPLRGRWRRAGHAAALLAGWAAFFHAWAVVLRTDGDARGLLAIMLASAVLFPLLTLGWVLYNRALSRAGRTRVANPAVSRLYRRDWNAVPIVADWVRLRHAPSVRLEQDGGGKRYRRAPVRPAAARPGRP